MGRKKIMNEEQKEAIFNNDEVLSALKERWFRLAKQEKFPKTPDITKKLDELEKTIQNRKEELVKL